MEQEQIETRSVELLVPECPYLDDEVIYEVRMLTGRLYTGRFVSVSLPRPFWTLDPEDAEADGWLDINPGHIVALAPAEAAVSPTPGRLRP